MTGTHVDPTVTVPPTRAAADEAVAPAVPPRHAAPPEPGSARDTATERHRHPRRVAAIIALVGIALSVASAWAAARIDRNTEQSLLDGQTRQAAAVLSAAIMVVQQPLEGALDVQAAARPGDRARVFRHYMSAHLGPDLLLQNASLWVRRDGRLERIASVGPRPAMRPASSDTRAYLRRAFTSKTTTVRFVTVAGRIHVVYARADPADGAVVYAERVIPENRRSPIAGDSAFHDLHYALYLGRTTKPSALATTDVDPSTLPFDGRTARQAVPFGDNVLTLVATARGHLGSDLSSMLPWFLLVGGLLLTAAATRTGRRLALGRQTAEGDAATISALFDRAERLYDQQRELFVSLQRALLPHVNPEVPNLELASRYVAGARGLDIGGDWYSIIDLEDGRFGFVVGDVSGRGVEAVAVMAHARFTIRAYLVDGDDPATVLEKCGPQFDIALDGHLTTALVGIGDWRSGEITLASAGHPPPVLLTDAGPTFVDVSPGRPLGTGVDRFEMTTVTMPAGSTLFCDTDGLVERRGEDIDAGLDRLAGVLADAAGASAEGLVTRTVDTLRHDDTADDIAILAIRWTGHR
ncbi:MAG TPA: PP2C family protein-serine/threonine phosphatase [Marmoricola sp.]|nr:PP2C family protein-serine/threonine phosphatase [Marmoricola sp.]